MPLSLALAAVAAAAAAPATTPAPVADDAHCVLAFYLITILHEMKQGGISDEGATNARDGFLYYSGRLSGHTGDGALRTAIASAAKDKSADVKAIATSCLHAMGERLEKTEQAVKAAN